MGGAKPATFSDGHSRREGGLLDPKWDCESYQVLLSNLVLLRTIFNFVILLSVESFPASGQPFFKNEKIAHIAEWHSGLITQRSMDRNHAPLILRCFLSADALGGLLLKINPRRQHKPSIHT